MDLVVLEKKDNVAILTLSKGKVNALNSEVIEELRESRHRLDSNLL